MDKPLEQLYLENEIFIKSLLKRSSKLYLTKSGKPRKKLNLKDLYQKEILEICLNLHSNINTLCLSRCFLVENKTFLNESAQILINKSSFFRYHIECFFIRVTSYKDLIIKLINKTYELGVNENIGLEGKIRKEVKNKKIEEISKLLIGLDIIMDKIKPVRNQLAHGDYYIDVNLALIQSMESTQRIESDEYEESVKRFLLNNNISMYTIELMLVVYLKFIYKRLLPKRREMEKMKATGGSLL
ncbi:hypothetical protein AAW12_04985 [Sphingobacterium sp. Ag1]|uniref:Cthe_2314 family HEPN domain-containing protein n=1 Tax=Sphingobacterium sp. Ag1 TaxID=1643451 RepID=UPI000627E024|nr:Cthe_2314 family HEPN domain-containing protein [Sphingobacterium sp. Ag1]KKO92457.1 hypothetical protein AAW12_04985 [Sphingobacterium sp. Ag1]